MIVVVIAVALGAVAIPNFIKARRTRASNPCIVHLKQMEGAKHSWSLMTSSVPTTIPADSDIFGPSTFIRAKPFCPLGGTYSLNAVSAKPTCSKSGAPDFHTL